MQIEALQSIILAVAQARSVETVLQMVVQGLNDQPQVALARIWLIAPGDICASCRMRSECPDQARCLHLTASAGNPKDRQKDWSRLDGHFCRFPLNVRKIGRIGATGEPVLLQQIERDSQWIVHSDWAQREGIQSFAGHPLIFRSEILGVLGLFSRVVIDEPQFAWLRTFADHAAVAIANARAFEEIQKLQAQLEMENRYLREEVKMAFGDIVGESPALRKVLQQIEIVAPTEASVLILGETGTGKELLARAIHERSMRRERPLVKVNCSAIPRELFESEFFGHVKGAFTGALRDRLGRFQMADGGTLFLDEIGEIPLELQSKLLRVLQEGQFERIGEDRTRQVDVRIIAATNRNLQQEIEAGRFRQDLYFRLSVFPITVPPLRERNEDIPMLAHHFIERACARLNCPPARITPEQMEQLQSYHWPGNVRELQNVIERAAILAQGGLLQFDHALPPNLGEAIPAPTPQKKLSAPSGVIREENWKEQERENILAALEQTRWKISGTSGAALLLGVKPSTLAYRMKVLDIRKK
jgi:transcriptional regulator with GAF, ATPase, and Fis domain